MRSMASPTCRHPEERSDAGPTHPFWQLVKDTRSFVAALLRMTTMTALLMPLHATHAKALPSRKLNSAAAAYRDE